MIVDDRQILILASEHDRILSMDCSPDGKHIVFANYHYLIIYDLESMRQICLLSGHSNWVKHVKYSPKGSRIASVSGQQILIWSVKKQTQINELIGSISAFITIAYSPHGEFLAAGNYTKISIWSCKKRQDCVIQQIDGVFQAYMRNGRYIIYKDTNLRIVICDMRSTKIIKQINGKMSKQIHQCLNNYMLMITHSDVIKLIEGKNGRLIRKYCGHAGVVSSLSISPNNGLIATTDYYSIVRIWDLRNGQLKCQIKLSEKIGAHKVIFSQNGQFIILGGLGVSPRMVNVANLLKSI